MRRINLDACPECDVLLNRAFPVMGEKAHCPRCGYLLQRPRRHSIERTFALSVSGLILMMPANLMPLISIKIFGNSNDGSLWSGVVMLIKDDMWIVAALVFLSSMLFPVLTIILSLLISGHLFFDKPNPNLAVWMRWLQHLDEWAMLEVYMLGIIVACVKLSSLAELKFGFGLYAFVALLMVAVTLSSGLDHYQFWQRINDMQKQQA
ncbi:MAG: paraquat-inducible membrane protein A [Methylococcaceae bacterium]|nr:paraquat-inducible membrane protein A [Methylococcaceae bacterium]